MPRQDDVVLDDDEWHTITLFEGVDDQEGLLFMRVDDNDDQTAIVGIHPHQVERMRDYFTSFLSRFPPDKE